MLKILISSYTCCPNMGSEPGMGWNWIVNLARYCEVYVIAEGEFRPKIEEFLNRELRNLGTEALRNLPSDAPERFAERMHFYWNPVAPEVRKMCWNQGDWRFYKYYRDWQKKTAEIARKIISENYNNNENTKDKHGIDVLHQLNMIGFREPGYLWEVSKETGVPFVWGPIGGLKQFPMAYADGGGLKMKVFNRIKNAINIYQIKYDKRVTSALKQASLLISSIPDSYNAIKKYHGLESVVIPETGCEYQEFHVQEKSLPSNHSSLTILWVGKFDFRKRLDIALKAIAEIDRDVELHVYGTGNDEQVNAAQKLAENLNIDNKVHFMGNRPNVDVKKAMRSADLFLFTSVSEDTSTVVLEAISNNLPVLCFDACGMAAVIDETVGRKIPLTNPSQSVHDFAEQLRFFYDNRGELIKRKEGCQAKAIELNWDNKVKQMIEIYKKVKA